MQNNGQNEDESSSGLSLLVVHVSTEGMIKCGGGVIGL